MRVRARIHNTHKRRGVAKITICYAAMDDIIIDITLEIAKRSIRKTTKN